MVGFLFSFLKGITKLSDIKFADFGTNFTHCVQHYYKDNTTKELIAISIKEVETYNKLFRSIGDAIQSFFYHLVRQKSHSGLKSGKKFNFGKPKWLKSTFFV